MRPLHAGLGIGAAAGLVAGWLLAQYSSPAPRVEPPAPAPAPARPAAVTERPRSAPENAVSAAPPAAAAEPEFPAGTALLRRGDCYNFGEPRVGPAASRRDADVYCLAIDRESVTLGAYGRTLEVRLPYASDSGALTSEACFAALKSAPDTSLGRTTASLRRSPIADQSGVAIVRAGFGGRYYKVMLVAVEQVGDAATAARIRYEEVPSRRGGGGLELPGQPTESPAPSVVREEVKQIQKSVEYTGESFSNFLSGDYVRIAGLAADINPDRGSFLMLEDALQSKVTFNKYSGLIARRGIAISGKVEVKSYSGILCQGDLAGTVDVRSYAFLYIEGNLTGTVDVNSYATIAVQGDIAGKLSIRSYVTLILKGRVTGTLETEGWGSGDCFINRYADRVEAESLRGAKGVKLHLRESDLPAGSHEGIGDWKEVIVDEESWERAAR